MQGVFVSNVQDGFSQPTWHGRKKGPAENAGPFVWSGKQDLPQPQQDAACALVSEQPSGPQPQSFCSSSAENFFMAFVAPLST